MDGRYLLAIYKIKPSSLKGSLSIPPSKSHTLRAILFAALAKGTSKIEHFLPSPDTKAMIEAVRLLGAEVTIESNIMIIKGVAGKPTVADDVIQCENSGLVLRLIGAIAGLIPAYTILTGDKSIRHKRPIKPLLIALRELGADAYSARGDGYAPILIRGPITKNRATLDGKDSQPVSGMLITAAFAPHPIELYVYNAGEKPWIDLTLSWLNRLQIPYMADGYSYYRLQGNSIIAPFSYSVPGDWGSAAFPIAAALLTNSDLTINNLDNEDIQGDKKILSLLQEMGAKIAIEKNSVRVEKGGSLRGIKIDINSCIDALPILAVVGAFAEGTTEIAGGQIAREKESDRIAAITAELKKMGAKIEERQDGVIIQKSTLKGSELESHHDHRIALSLSIAALAAKGESTIHGVECTQKSYPGFFPDFHAIGAKIEI